MKTAVRTTFMAICAAVAIAGADGALAQDSASFAFTVSKISCDSRGWGKYSRDCMLTIDGHTLPRVVRFASRY